MSTKIIKKKHNQKTRIKGTRNGIKLNCITNEQHNYSEGNGKNPNLGNFGKQYFDCLP